MGQKSFRDRVKERAISKTWKTARAHLGQSMSILAIVTVFTLLGTVAAKGGSAAWSDAQTYLITVCANALTILLMFGWNLWLAPYELVMEEIGGIRDAIKAAPTAAAPAPTALPPPKPINWAIWKQRSSYNLEELAAILAKIDPSGSKSPPDKASFLKLLTEDAMKGALRVTADRNAEHYYKPDLWPSYFDVQKSDAQNWAKAKGFDLAHIT